MMRALLVSCLLATAALVNGAALHPETEGYHHTVSHYGGGGSSQTHVRHNLNVYPRDDGTGAYVHQEPGRFAFGVHAHAPSVSQVLAHGGYGVGLGGAVAHGVGGLVSHGVGSVVAHAPAAGLLAGHGLYGAGLSGAGLYGGALYGHGLSGGALYGHGLYGAGYGGLYGHGLYGARYGGLYGAGSGLYGAGYGGLYGAGLYGAGYGTGLYGSGAYGSAALYGRPYSRSYQVRNTNSLRQYVGLDGSYLAHHPEVHHYEHETAHP